MLLFNTFFNKLSKLSIESLTEEKKTPEYKISATRE